MCPLRSSAGSARHRRRTTGKEKNMRGNRRWGRALLPALVAGAVLACAGTASAATCTYSASGNWTTGGSCGATPAATDTVVINSGVNVAVDASHTIAGITMNGGTITFSGTSPTLTDTGPLSTSSNNLLTGDGALTVGGTEDNSSGQLTLEESADLVLNSTSGLSSGSICTLGSGPGTTDDPSVQINGTFTIGSGADASPLSCNSGINTAAIRVGATGVLVDARPGTTDIGTPIQVAQGGLVHVTTGLLSIDGGSAGATDDGEWSVDANTTLRFTGSNQLNTLGSHTSIHGAGTFDVFNTVTVPLGATFTIAHLTIELATVELDDNATTYTPNTVTLNAGTLAGDRDVT